MITFASVNEEYLLRIAQALEQIAAHLDHAFGLPGEGSEPSVTWADEDQQPVEGAE